MGAGGRWAPLLTGGELSKLPTKCCGPVAERGQLVLIQNFPVPRWCAEQRELTGSSDRGRYQGLVAVRGPSGGDWALDAVLPGDESIELNAFTFAVAVRPLLALPLSVQLLNRALQRRRPRAATFHSSHILP
jgi:hypothetical protein